MSTIVVGHDGSETSGAAVREAARLAEALGDALHIVVAYNPSAATRIAKGEPGWSVGGMDDAQQIVEDVSNIYESRLAVTHTISTEDPADALVDTATELDASMIVVGNRRTQGISRVLGSVASSVMRKAPCSVHVAHTS